MKTLHSYLVIALAILFVAGCEKSDSPPGVDNPPIKPEWRVKKVTTQSFDLKAPFGFDTTEFEYDSKGRLSILKYVLRAYSSTREENVRYAYEFTYADNTERVIKIERKGNHWAYGSYVEELTYDATGTKLESIKTGNSIHYGFNYNGHLPASYTYVQLGETYNDTTKTSLEFNHSRIVKRIDKRYNGENVNTASYEYNPAGNLTLYEKNGRYGDRPPDTMRKIFFTWVPSPTANSSKLKPLPVDFWMLKPNDFAGLFYFNTYALLTEIDIFKLCSNGEVLSNYRWTWMRDNLSPSEMNYEYHLDADKNIGKVTGKAPRGNTRFEMLLEYEKIP